jgi:hypothetical protein
VLRDLARNNVLPAVPWILIIDISRDIISFHLDMGRHRDVCPGPAVIIEGLKSFRRLRRLFRIGKLPQTVQGAAKYRSSGCPGRLICPLLQLFLIRKNHVVRMGGEAVYLEKSRIRDDGRIKALLPGPGLV